MVQGGANVYTQSYGLRTSPKVWGLGGCAAAGAYAGLGSLSTECRWIYGSTENMVWEGPSLQYKRVLEYSSRYGTR